MKVVEIRNAHGYPVMARKSDEQVVSGFIAFTLAMGFVFGAFCTWLFLEFVR